ncbi:hypothetical protein PtA15_8A689 [Puccinia triticina]|uniref:LisH domain-containing protein n=1 Tax=Puccinia triticina TaxID=208348 RepID=A0ABY7CS70_9BASI|nr:uncharacterized protein PtA15_8A689 [Puccinia triticina]WAQ87783.1 hypothetical protein PtA15_8A689 [Puccinia triticina]
MFSLQQTACRTKPPRMEDTNSFSLIDQLRPCLNTCFPCLAQSSSPPSASANSYFPDSDHRGLLEEQEALNGQIDHAGSEEPVSAYYFQSNSQLSRWELLISWLSSKTLDRLSSKPLHPFDNDIETSALAHGDQADALLLDDISIALKARSLHRQSSSKSKSNARTVHQPQPVPSPSVTATHTKKKSRNSEHAHGPTHQQFRPNGSQASAPVNKKIDSRGSLDDPKQKRLKDLNPSTPSLQKRSKSRSKSSKQSSSAYTDDTADSEPSSVPSLITSRTTTTTVTSSSNPASDPLELNVEIIKFIHQNYNQECRRLYGRDLSRVQIQQLCEYLISRGFDDAGAAPLLPSSAVTGVTGAEPHAKTQDQTDGSPGEVQAQLSTPGSTATRPPVEIESLKRIQLSSTEFLQAIKQTKTSQQQQNHASDTANARPSSPIDDPFDGESDDDLFPSSSFLDWFSKGSQLLSSDIFDNLSVNQSAT